MPGDYEIVITRPCTDTPNRFIAESAFGRKLAMAAVCEKLKAVPGARCSESLGVARFDYGDWTFILYHSGRIDLRNVIDPGHAQAGMREMERFLAGAFEAEGSDRSSSGK